METGEIQELRRKLQFALDEIERLDREVRALRPRLVEPVGPVPDGEAVARAARGPAWAGLRTGLLKHEGSD